MFSPGDPSEDGVAVPAAAFSHIKTEITNIDWPQSAVLYDTNED